MKRVNVVVTCAAMSWALGAGCSVFEPPLPEGDGSGGRDGSGGEGSGGEQTSSGGRVSSGGQGGDASVDSGGTPSTGGSGGATGSGGAAPGSGGKAGTGGKGSTEPFWLDVDTNGCTHARLPTRNDRPAASDPGEEMPPVMFAMSRARHGASKDDAALTKDENGWVDTGFDLDGVCTASATCEVDEVRVNDTVCKNATTKYPPDGNLCRDNAIGKIITIANNSPYVGEYFGLNDQDWNCELRRGGFSGLIKLSKYNGKLNDRDVRVDMYTSTGLQVGLGWQCRESPDAPLDAEWPEHATWPKTNHWKIADRTIDPASTLPDPNELPNSLVYDPVAFVRNGYLVAYLPDKSEFWWNGENTPVPGFRDVMHHPVIVAKLIEDPDGSWRIDQGTLTSVVLPGEMIKSFRELGYCENMCNAYSTLIGYLNGASDVFGDPDVALPDAACDGLSIAIDFEAREATANKADLVKVKEPTECPNPRNPKAPRQGCTCINQGDSCAPGDPGDAGGG